jgi:hypothetical protein
MNKAIDFIKYIVGTHKVYTKSAVRGKYVENDVKNKLVFITLTLSSPQIHTDEEIKSKLLNQFLTEMRQKHKMKYYIWKAEKQKNGSIHFHILTDKGLHWRTVRTLWNRIQNKLGYVDRYRSNMKEFFKLGFKVFTSKYEMRTAAQQYEAYKRGVKCDWTDPNSTDVHRLYDVKNVTKYITKYLTKSNEPRKARMIELQAAITEVKDKISAYGLESWGDHDLFVLNVKVLEQYEAEYTKLKSEGVTGRLWGVSQSISPMKGLSELGYPDELDLIMEISHYKTSIDTGSDIPVRTFYFDINKTPILKNELDQYIYQKAFTNEVFNL